MGPSETKMEVLQGEIAKFPWLTAGMCILLCMGGGRYLYIYIDILIYIYILIIYMYIFLHLSAFSGVRCRIIMQHSP